MQAGVPFTPTPKGSTGGKKRKNKRGEKKGSFKRRRVVADDEDDDIDDSESSDSDSELDDEMSNGTSSDNEDGDNEKEMGEVTEELLKEKIHICKDFIKTIRERHNEARVRKKEASDALSSLEKMSVKVQKEKNAFCSLKRSEVSTVYPHSFSCLSSLVVLARCTQGGFSYWIKRSRWLVFLPFYA